MTQDAWAIARWRRKSAGDKQRRVGAVYYSPVLNVLGIHGVRDKGLLLFVSIFERASSGIF